MLYCLLQVSWLRAFGTLDRQGGGSHNSRKTMRIHCTLQQLCCCLMGAPMRLLLR